MTLCVPERNGKYSIEKTFVYCGYDTAYSRMCIFLVYGNRAAGYAVSGSCYIICWSFDIWYSCVIYKVMQDIRLLFSCFYIISHYNNINDACC